MRLGISAFVAPFAVAFLHGAATEEGPLLARIGLFAAGASWTLLIASTLAFHRLLRGVHEPALGGGLFMFGFGIVFVGFILGDVGEASWGLLLVALPMALAIAIAGVLVLREFRSFPLSALKAAAAAV